MSTIVPPAPGAQADEHALYRFFGADGSLLYVGISLQPFRRMGQHRSDKSWWGEVATVAIERHPDRPSVLAAERRAIKAENPRYNVVHAGRRSRLDRPQIECLYTYWEPAVGGPVTVANCTPAHPGVFTTNCPTCGTADLSRDITDPGGEDWVCKHKCSTCHTTFTSYISKIGPSGRSREYERCLLLRPRRGA